MRQAKRRMPPSRGGVGDELSSRQDDDDDDGGQWEDYTCQGSFEDLIRSLEVVLREWGACDTGIVQQLTDSWRAILLRWPCGLDTVSTNSTVELI